MSGSRHSTIKEKTTLCRVPYLKKACLLYGGRILMNHMALSGITVTTAISFLTHIIAVSYVKMMGDRMAFVDAAVLSLSVQVEDCE